MKPRLEREREFRREYIIEATEKLLNEKTFEAITMDDIATASGFAKATIYQYFKNKEELLIGVFSRILKLECRLIEEKCLPQADPVQAMQNYLMLEFDFVNQYSWLLKVIANVPLKSYAESSLTNEYEHKKELVAGIIRRGQQEGAFMIYDLGIMTDMILLISQGFAAYFSTMFSLSKGNVNNIESTINPEIELFIFHVMKGIRRESNDG